VALAATVQHCLITRRNANVTFASTPASRQQHSASHPQADPDDTLKQVANRLVLVAQAAHHKAAAEEKRLLVLYNCWLPDPTPLAIWERIWCKSGIMRQLSSGALACILPLQMASNADSPPAPRHLLHPTCPHILARLHLRRLPHSPALPPVASVLVASVPLAVVHHPLCDLTQVRVPGSQASAIKHVHTSSPSQPKILT
jgi:hypothetical protein